LEVAATARKINNLENVHCVRDAAIALLKLRLKRVNIFSDIEYRQLEKYLYQLRIGAILSSIARRAAEGHRSRLTPKPHCAAR
jgi:hypothetical protein